MSRPRIRAGLAGAVAALAAGTVLTATITAPVADAAPTAEGSTGPAQVRSALRADVERNLGQVLRWRREHAGTPPTRAWFRDHRVRTGRDRLLFLRSDAAFCLVGHNARAGLKPGEVLWASSDVRGVRRTTWRVLTSSSADCATLVRQAVRREAARTVRSDLLNAATAAETWATDHPDSHDPYTLAQLHGLGFTESPGTTVRIWGSPAAGYCIRGRSPRLHLPADQGVWYDAVAGGLTDGYHRPRGGACEDVAARVAG